MLGEHGFARSRFAGKNAGHIDAAEPFQQGHDAFHLLAFRNRSQAPFLSLVPVDVVGIVNVDVLKLIPFVHDNVADISLLVEERDGDGQEFGARDVYFLPDGVGLFFPVHDRKDGRRPPVPAVEIKKAFADHLFGRTAVIPLACLIGVDNLVIGVIDEYLIVHEMDE